jgi:hypothetical protein
MNRYKITYSSMTAFYDMGYIFAESQEEAEREARSKATAFSQGEKSLIRARKDNG